MSEGDERNLWDIRATPARTFGIAPELTLEAIVARREFCAANAPQCPNKCRPENGLNPMHFMQLLHSSTSPAIWKCRICKTKFEFEPEKKE